MGLRLITAPASPVLTLAEAKEHLRVTHTAQDALITALEKAATQNAEGWLGRALIDQTWELVLDAFPTTNHKEIEIPKPPLIEIVSIIYDDAAGVPQTISALNYFVDNVSQPGWVVPTGSLTWPVALDAINSVRVRFRAGYLDNSSPPVANVPDDIRSAIKLILGALFEYRELQLAGQSPDMPWAAENLLRRHRVELGMA